MAVPVHEKTKTFPTDVQCHFGGDRAVLILCTGYHPKIPVNDGKDKVPKHDGRRRFLYLDVILRNVFSWQFQKNNN